MPSNSNLFHTTDSSHLIWCKTEAVDNFPCHSFSLLPLFYTQLFLTFLCDCDLFNGWSPPPKPLALWHGRFLSQTCNSQKYWVMEVKTSLRHLKTYWNLLIPPLAFVLLTGFKFYLSPVYGFGRFEYKSNSLTTI